MVMPNISIPDFVRRNTAQVTHKRSVRWDFETGEMQTGPDGKILIYSGEATVRDILQNRIRKVFATVRGEAVIYPLSYGSDLHMLIGKPPDYVEARILNMVAESLSSISLIDRIELKNLSFGRDYATFDISVWDKQNTQVDVANIMLPGVSR